MTTSYPPATVHCSHYLQQTAGPTLWGRIIVVAANACACHTTPTWLAGTHAAHAAARTLQHTRSSHHLQHICSVSVQCQTLACTPGPWAGQPILTLPTERSPPTRRVFVSPAASSRRPTQGTADGGTDVLSNMSTQKQNPSEPSQTFPEEEECGPDNTQDPPHHAALQPTVAHTHTPAQESPLQPLLPVVCFTSTHLP